MIWEENRGTLPSHISRCITWVTQRALSHGPDPTPGDPWQRWALPPQWMWERPHTTSWVTGRSCWRSCVSESTAVLRNPVEESRLYQSVELGSRRSGSLAASLRGRLAVNPPLQGTEGHVGPPESDHLLIIAWAFSEMYFRNTHIVFIFKLYLLKKIFLLW